MPGLWRFLSAASLACAGLALAAPAWRTAHELKPARRAVDSSAWATFATLVSPDGQPTWSDWCAIANTPEGSDTLSCPASPAPMAAGDRKLRLMRHLAPPRQLARTVEGTTADTPGGSGLAEVVLNPAAVKSIRARLLKHDAKASFADALAAIMKAAGETGDTASAMEGLDSGSVILKADWTVISYPDPVLGSGVHVSLQRGAALQRVTMVGPQTAPCHYNAASKMISPSCFFTFPASTGDMSSLGSAEHLDISNLGSAGGPYYFLLLGFHVMRKVDKQWKWQTFWWDLDTLTGEPDAAFAAAHETGNPRAAAGPWAHFAKDEMPLGATADFGTVYNPYIEKNVDGTRQVNCVRCHNNASFHPDTGSTAGAIPACYFSIGTAYGFSPAKPIAPQCTQYVATRDKGLATDSIWNLADSNDTLLHKPNAQTFMAKPPAPTP